MSVIGIHQARHRGATSKHRGIPATENTIARFGYVRASRSGLSVREFRPLEESSWLEAWLRACERCAELYALKNPFVP